MFWVGPMSSQGSFLRELEKLESLRGHVKMEAEIQRGILKDAKLLALKMENRAKSLECRKPIKSWKRQRE